MPINTRCRRIAMGLSMSTNEANGVAMSPPTTAIPIEKKNKSKSSPLSLFSLNCGCSNARSVSVATSHTGSSHKTTTPSAASLSGRQHPHSLSTRFEFSSADTITLTTATTSTSHIEEEEEEEEESPSFAGLLQELSQLERSVIAWGHGRQIPSGWAEPLGTGEAGEGEKTHRHQGKPHKEYRERRQKQRRHRRSQSVGDGGCVMGKMGGSVVVVTETEDPLGEFRRSMLQMIVEEDIVCPEELRELLHRFLALNSPSHHGLVVRAFAEIWRDVFSGHLDDVPDLIPPAALQPHRRLSAASAATRATPVTSSGWSSSLPLRAPPPFFSSI